MLLESERIALRALEKGDALKLMLWENNPQFWHVSETEAPFSLQAIEDFINQNGNFRQTGQIRLMIMNNSSSEAIGCVDLFDGHNRHRRAGVGILIAEDQHRGQGFASESLKLLTDYARDLLDLHQLYAHIADDNLHSIRLFENSGFEYSGTLKQWRRYRSTWQDVLIYQKILSHEED